MCFDTEVRPDRDGILLLQARTNGWCLERHQERMDDILELQQVLIEMDF
jgi:hypothetical protein